jgi:hypothetical protein
VILCGTLSAATANVAHRKELLTLLWMAEQLENVREYLPAKYRTDTFKTLIAIFCLGCDKSLKYTN